MYCQASFVGWTDFLFEWIRTGCFHCKNGFTQNMIRAINNYIIVRWCDCLSRLIKAGMQVISSGLPNAIVYCTHHCRVGVVHSSGRGGTHRHGREGLLVSKVIFILSASPSSVFSKSGQYHGRSFASFLRSASRLDAPRSHGFPLSYSPGPLRTGVHWRYRGGALQAAVRRLTSRYTYRRHIRMEPVRCLYHNVHKMHIHLVRSYISHFCEAYSLNKVVSGMQFLPQWI